MEPDNGWNEWKNHVLAELKRNNECHDTLEKKLDEMLREVTALKVKAGVWGAAAGCLPVIVGLGVWVLGSAGG